MGAGLSSSILALVSLPSLFLAFDWSVELYAINKLQKLHQSGEKKCKGQRYGMLLLKLIL